MNRLYPAGDRIAIQFSFNPLTLKRVKGLRDRLYHPKEKVWSIPLAESEESVEKLRVWGFDVPAQLEQVMQYGIKAREYKIELAQQKDAKFESPLPLFPYQRAGAAFLTYSGSALLGDDMGLGKTIQALAVVEKSMSPTKWVLVICPSALKYQWQSEIKKFLPKFPTYVIDGDKEERSEQWGHVWVDHQTSWPTRGIVIVNYELLIRDDFRRASEYVWDYIIADEATRISNPKAKQSKAIKKLKARHRIAMTGTPISNHANEIWNVIDFIEPGVLGSYWQFMERYCIKNQWNGVAGYQNIEELSRRIQPYMIRRLKKDVDIQLPAKLVTDVPFKLSEEEHALYDKIRKELLFEIEQSDINKIEDPTTIQMTLVKMTRLRQLTNSLELLGENVKSSKLEVLKEILTDVVVDNRKAIIFTGFSTMADILARELAEYDPLVISGKVKEEYRDVVAQFNEQDKHKVLIMTSAGQFGLNIQRASIIIHYDQEWSLAKMMQRDGRAHRFGQKHNVLVYNLLAKGSMDMYVRKVLHKKAQLSDKLLQDTPVTMDIIKEALTYDE
jgi:SNF2 family DNA or RNA helicase